MKLDRYYAQANEQEASLNEGVTGEEILIRLLSPCQQLELDHSSLLQRQNNLRAAWESTPLSMRELLKDTSLGALLETL